MAKDGIKRLNRGQYIRLVIKGVFALLLMTGIMMVLAGRLDYWQGWVYGLFSLVYGIIKAFLFADKTDLVLERLRPGPGTKWWDKVFWAFFLPLNFGVVIVGSLDAGRFGWTGPLPATVYILGYILFFLTLYLFTWAMYINPFFSSTVRIQTDRGQEVVRDGPYRYVRHPGYIAGILMLMAMPPALGSLWALAPAAILIVLLVIRTWLEDTTLQRELEGYAEYAGKVKYRLAPGLW